ncbi:MAG TPA: iron ABC transporter permease [Flavobacteriales bacterium]|nr:iron ABC transporter permease [Flavobacteriales bacterium]
MTSPFKTIRWGWFLLALLPVIVCSIPLLFVLVSATQIKGDELTDSFRFFSTGSIANTLVLCVGVLLLSLVLGVGSAYLFATYRFFGSRFFEIAFVLPIAIPGYIMAITYASFFNYSGLFYQNTGMYFNMMNMWGLVFTLALCLYPYVFITALHAFKLSSGNYNESATLLGIGRKKMFFKIALPLALPAIIAGAWLVFMETLNDFGAASYYGIRTLSTEIFRCWQIGPSVTVFLSLCILVFIVATMVIIQRYLDKKGYYQPSKSKPVQKIKLTGWKNLVVAVVCFNVFLFSFLLPVGILIAYAMQFGLEEGEGVRLWARTINSFQLAAIAAGVILVFCVINSYSKVIHRVRKTRALNFLSDFGYAVPGAVLAIALLSVSTFFDASLGTIVTGTFLFLIIAYMIRFYTVARGPVENMYNKLPQNLFNASASLGKKPLGTFFKIYLPILLPAFGSIFLLVFIDVLKELPITLILRPFNFETLSTSVYGYAKVNESVGQAAPYSLLIITLGVLAVLMLKRIEKKYGINKG